MFRSNGNNPPRNAAERGDDLPIAYDVTPVPPPYVTPTPTPMPPPYVTPTPTPNVLNPPGSHSKPDASANTRGATDAFGKEKKKKKKDRKKKMEPRTSIEAILVSPPSTKTKNHRAKQQDQNSNVVLLSETDVVEIPPPFLFPNGTMHLSNVVIPDSKAWQLSNKLSKGCQKLIATNASETNRHRESKIPVVAAEIVVYICAKKGNNFTVLTETVENNLLSNLSITRTHRSAILTRGTVQFKQYWSFAGCFLFGKKSNSPNITISLFDLRGIHVGKGSNNVVIVAFRHNQKQTGGATQEYEEQLFQPETIRYAIYQTPETGRFIVPLAQAVVAAYSSAPRWAIPITWSGNLPPLPATYHQQEKFSLARMGRDGGFSSTIYAAALAYHVKHKLNFAQKVNADGQNGISKRLMKQQPRRRFPARSSGPHVINPYEVALGLVNSLTTVNVGVKADLMAELVLAGLNALSFNLVFRKLKLPMIDRRDPELLCSYRNALGRALMYNVSLREVDFDSAHLSGFGETIGNAWAMNAQPLVSRINFSGCRLTEDDLLGLLRGLARIWCGGTALAESIRMANNPNISTTVWDIFFQAFLDPSKLSSWPQKPPPPPTLSFLQELDIRGTNAVGPGLVQIAEKLTGLRSLKLSSSGRSSTVSDVLSILWTVKAPLERIEGNDFDASCIDGLLAHHKTLKEITLIGFIGDASPLLCNWLQAMPKLSINIGKQYVPRSQPWAPPSSCGYSPGSISLGNSSNFSVKAMTCLANRNAGLKKLVIYDTFYWQLAGAMHTLADSGLEVLHIYPPDCSQIGRINKMNSIGLSKIEIFWKTLARSKTLRDLRCRNQLLGGSNSDEVAMVGRFLKSNRSVQSIWFDNDHLVLNLDDVKVLRSAFYGNKKVVEMEHLSKAKRATMEVFKKEIAEQLRLVQNYKHQIKMLFKRAYSKYNRYWRDGPNREKLPWIEKIRVAKRKIGKLNRDQDKIASLLGEIMRCITMNQGTRAGIEEAKANERINRRQPQLKQLATKKKKFVTNLVTKLRRAKIRGRQQKSAKMQVPRSTYYKSRNIWPSKNRFKNRYHSHSFYSYYNDPYYARYHPFYGHYDDDCSSNSENDFDTEQECDWLDSLYEETSCESEDPWANVDSLIQELEADYNCAMDPEYLASVHEECSELGIDVVEDVSTTLDTGAAVADKMDEIGTSMNVPNGMLTAVVDSSLEEQFDLAAIERTLPDIPDFEAGADDFEDMDNIMDADDAVGMYAGAGPRDLDDGGPSFGGSSNAALSGARRRARARKKSRSMNRVREKTNRRLKAGYQNLSITGISPAEIQKEESVWPDNLVSSWVEEAQMQQIKAMAESDMFDLPDVSSKSNSLLTEWSYSSIDQQLSHASIEVVLVTQCSIDRLPNLQAQLVCWTGKASIAVYVKPTENKLDAIDAILSTIKEAKSGAGNKNFDVAVTLVEGCIEEEPYPINYLRNVALLEAQKQHLRFNTSLDKSSTLLADVDFRPSTNLYKMLHSKSASKSIVKERKVIVCPAFESTTTTCPTTIASLKELVDKGQAEGFHQSHFPQGHGPTQFDTFWEKSFYLPDTTYESMEEYFWNESYSIRYEDLFEPYVVMASIDVPLYDERFQGYGLNKVSHLASVAREKKGEFLVLPGVFLVAPAHERSEAWGKIYGNSQSDDNKFNQLLLKGLYYKFMKNLENGDHSVVSENTRSKQQFILNQERDSKQSQEALNEPIQVHEAAQPRGDYIICH